MICVYCTSGGAIGVFTDFLIHWGIFLNDKPYIICGDFNCTEFYTHYQEPDIACKNNRTASAIREFIDLTDGVQINSCPNCMKIILDLIIINWSFANFYAVLSDDSLVEINRFHPVVYVDI